MAQGLSGLAPPTHTLCVYQSIYQLPNQDYPLKHVSKASGHPVQSSLGSVSLASLSHWILQTLPQHALVYHLREVISQLLAHSGMLQPTGLKYFAAALHMVQLYRLLMLLGNHDSHPGLWDMDPLFYVTDSRIFLPIPA